MLSDVEAIVRAVADPSVKQVQHGRWSFVADVVSLSQRDFADALFHNRRFAERKLRGVFDMVAMNVSLLHNWLALAKANARIPEENWREVSSSYMKQLRESGGYELFDSQRSAVRIPPLSPMIPLYDRDYTVAAKYGAIGTLLGAAAVHMFVSQLPRVSAARAKVVEKLDCFVPPRVSPPGPSRGNEP
ncbi:hypothetical protein HPB52_010908 [Rhipicephalus sanguineus]|uniref:Uncharacterized protein n=1 Tax=Rhipicephalus sanguineus TaxID=34632 RepID=A0A9D4SP36_RHISA|nr:hypothetical protein HPB52_010908 [Rhipicephalus sanguineus]